MNWRIIGAVGFLTAFSSFGYADDARAQQVALEKEITTLNQQISAKQQQINSLRNRPSPEQVELASVQKILSDARAQLKAAPSADNESKVRNAEFKLKLAEIKYDKSHADVEALSDDVDRLKQQVSTKQQQVKEVARAGSDQADQQQQQKLADERAKRQQQEQELARSKQEAEAAQKEIERLKAALAAKETAEAKATPVTTKIASTSTPAPVTMPVPAPVAAAPVAKPVSVEAVGGTAVVKLTSQQQVLAELQAMAQRSADAGSAKGTNRVLYLKQPGAAASNKDKVGLRAIGNEQYRGTFSVKPGNYEAVIGFNNWPVQFSADEDGENTFLLDYSDEKKPQLIIYSSRLEGGK